MKYLIAEKFKSVQGEGVYAGTPMAFIRFVGCSVGKTVCVACDTDFEEPVPWRGGGEFTALELLKWSTPYEHICFTGGEPLDQELEELVSALRSVAPYKTIHIETSGTKKLPDFFLDSLSYSDRGYWICVSPKPGFIEDVVLHADEVKVIMPGLGVLKHGVMQPVRRPHTITPSSPRDHVPEPELHRWPTLEDALRWADAGKTVFIQPRNGRSEIDQTNLRLCQDIVAEYPQLRLSVQLHKILKVQ